jgi:hypothetical protein
MHYDAEATLARVSNHPGLVVALGAIALLANWYYFYECARLGRRDRVAPMALWATTIFIGHDGSYLLRYDDWFNGYDHWFPKLFWVGLIVTFSFEVIFFALTVRYGREELAPRLTERQWQLYCLGALVTGVLFWTIVKSVLSDPLYMMTFVVTLGMCVPATLPLVLRRGARIGVGMRQMWAYLVIGVGFLALLLGVLQGPFHEPLWWIGGGFCLGLAVVQLVLVHRLPEPAPAGLALAEQY